MRPWTAVATEKTTLDRMTIVFHADWDAPKAATDFMLRYEALDLVALIPGDHKEVYIQPYIATNNRGPKIPLNQMFSGF